MNDEHLPAITVLELRIIQLNAIVKDAETMQKGCQSNAATGYWRLKAAKVEAEMKSINNSIEWLKNELPF